MHTIQTKLLALIKSKNIGELSLRKIAQLIGEDGKPANVKYHLEKLSALGLIQLDLNSNIIKPVKSGYVGNQTQNPIFSVPILGSANCGPATLYAEENLQGYLKVSQKLLPYNKSNLFALIADGNSMNKTDVDGKNIEDGDFVLIDSEKNNYTDGDKVVAVIDNLANIKKFRKDKINNRIVLESESTEKYLPIYVYPEDDFIINGKVVGVIKK